jgi:hypothetical protein
MRQRVTRWVGATGLVLLISMTAAGRAHAAPVNLEFVGSIFNVSDPSDVFGTMIGDIYSLRISYDPALLPGTDSGDFTFYESAAGETSIAFSFESPGDAFTSDNSFPIRIGIRNTPDYLETLDVNDGKDSFSIRGNVDDLTTLNLVMLESLGSNPLSSNDLPTGAFGGGPGTWSTSELDIDRTDLFANISGSVANIYEVTRVPEPSTLSLAMIGGAGLWIGRRRKGGRGPS